MLKSGKFYAKICVFIPGIVFLYQKPVSCPVYTTTEDWWAVTEIQNIQVEHNVIKHTQEGGGIKNWVHITECSYQIFPHFERPSPPPQWLWSTSLCSKKTQNYLIRCPKTRAFFSPRECWYFPCEFFKSHRKYWPRPVQFSKNINFLTRNFC